MAKTNSVIKTMFRKPTLAKSKTLKMGMYQVYLSVTQGSEVVSVCSECSSCADLVLLPYLTQTNSIVIYTHTEKSHQTQIREFSPTGRTEGSQPGHQKTVGPPVKWAPKAITWNFNQLFQFPGYIFIFLLLIYRIY